MRTILISLFSLFFFVTTVSAGGNTPATVPSDTDGTFNNLSADYINNVRMELNLSVGAYQNSEGTQGGQFSAGFYRPQYIYGTQGKRYTIGILMPVMSGAEGNISMTRDSELDAYGIRVMGTGIRFQAKYFKQIYDGKDEREANAKLSARQSELEKTGKSKDLVWLRKEGHEYSADEYFVEENVSGPIATGEVVLLPTYGVLKRKKALGTREMGVEGSLIEVSGHVAFKLNNVPIDLCARMNAVGGIYGKSDLVDVEGARTVWKPFSGSVCVGVSPVSFGGNRLYVRNQTNAAFTTHKGSIPGLTAEDAPISGEANTFEFNTTTSIEQTWGTRRYGVFYDYSYDRAQGIDPTLSRAIRTHMFGITIH